MLRRWRVLCHLLSCVSRCACARLNAKEVWVCTSEQFSNPSNPSHQDAAISADQFPLNLDELLMPTFCFLLMGKSFGMDFFLLFFLAYQWIHQLFKVSILFPRYCPGAEKRWSGFLTQWHCHSDLEVDTSPRTRRYIFIDATPPGCHVYTELPSVT